ncbi:hypothetical protein F5Y17DRAFT_458936 [Xylariaceae sp. FL0594]|nr:hypothetical protein F5Y17DRAFT_458936 [Xylariaceae sp. FL0594]
MASVDPFDFWSEVALQVDHDTRHIKFPAIKYHGLGVDGQRFISDLASNLMNGPAEYYLDEYNPARMYLGVEQQLVRKGFVVRRPEGPGLPSLAPAHHAPSPDNTVPATRQSRKRRADQAHSDNDVDADGNHIKRPRNSWVIFRQEMQVEVRKQIWVENNGKWPKDSNGVVSTRVSEMWKVVSPEVKAIYEAKAEAEKKAFYEKYPDYRYQPRRKAKPAGSAQPNGRQAKRQRTRAAAPSAAAATPASRSGAVNGQQIQPSPAQVFDASVPVHRYQGGYVYQFGHAQLPVRLAAPAPVAAPAPLPAPTPVAAPAPVADEPVPAASEGKESLRELQDWLDANPGLDLEGDQGLDQAPNSPVETAPVQGADEDAEGEPDYEYLQAKQAGSDMTEASDHANISQGPDHNLGQDLIDPRLQEGPAGGNGYQSPVGMVQAPIHTSPQHRPAKSNNHESPAGTTAQGPVSPINDQETVGTMSNNQNQSPDGNSGMTPPQASNGSSESFSDDAMVSAAIQAEEAADFNLLFTDQDIEAMMAEVAALNNNGQLGAQW